MLSETPALYPLLNGYSNLTYALDLRQSGETSERLDQITRGLALDLQRLKKLMPTMLSPGEQQRLALARVLAAALAVLLLDEPLSSLDD